MDNSLVLKLSRVKSEFYDNEKALAQAFRSLLAQYEIYPTRKKKTEGTAYEPDGNILYEISVPLSPR